MAVCVEAIKKNPIYFLQLEYIFMNKLFEIFHEKRTKYTSDELAGR